MFKLVLNSAITLIAIFAISFSGLTQTTYYFDPTNSNDPLEDGSMLHPFDSYEDIDWEDYGVYLLKRNTTMTLNSMITLEADYVVFGAYGTGDRPVVYSTTTQHVFKAWQKWDVVFQDLEIDAPNAVSGINFLGNLTRNATVQNCKIHGMEWGVRGINGWSGMTILNCEIFNTENDGIYAEVDSIEIAHCNIYNVNLAWFENQNQSYSSGDCIQLNGACDNFYVHHNILDHSSTGNKFCFIAGGDPNSSGIFEYNTCIGDSALVFACLYIQPSLSDIHIRYNTLSSAQTGIYCNAMGASIYYNVIEKCDVGVNMVNYSSAVNTIYNNVFYNNHLGYASNFSATELKNNIFYNEGTNDRAFGYPYSNIITTDYNVIYPEHVDFIEYSYATYNTLADYQSASGNAANSLSVNPMFIDAANGNFHLQANSPCIGAGIGVGLTQDFSGADVQPASVDCGIYQFSGQTVQTTNILPTWDYVNSINSHTINIPPTANLLVVGDSIEDGDYIGVFYEDAGDFLCCGYSQWNAAGCTITAYGYDGVNPGLQPAEELKLRVWKVASGVEYAGCANYETSYPDTCLYNLNGQSCIQMLLAKEITNHSLVFNQGWNLFSSYINPINANMESVFANHASNVEIVKEEGGDIYWPQFNVNQIGDIQPGKGYMVRVSDTMVVDLLGVQLVPEEIQLTLVHNYGYIGFPYPAPAPILSTLDAVITDVELIKDENGLICWLDYNINEIGVFNPGEGYQIKMKNTVLFTYPSEL